MTRKSFTAEFKREAVRLLETSGYFFVTIVPATVMEPRPKLACPHFPRPFCRLRLSRQAGSVCWKLEFPGAVYHLTGSPRWPCDN
jgi:hypothetical protein